MYELKPQWRRHVLLAVITTDEGIAKRVSFTGKSVESVVAATAKAPEYTVTIPAITQAEIEWLIKNGHPYGAKFQLSKPVAKPSGEPIKNEK